MQNSPSNIGVQLVPIKKNQGEKEVFLSIPKKIYPKAVDRNRLKRILRVATKELPSPPPEKQYIVRVFGQITDTTDIEKTLVNQAKSLLSRHAK